MDTVAKATTYQRSIATTALMVAGISALAFGVLAVFVTYGLTLPADRAILTAINYNASLPLDAFFTGVTDLGGVIAITAISVALTAYLLIQKKYTRALFVVTAIAGSSALGYMFKSLFDRTRPDLWEWLIHETYFSFPSGHATASMALALCIVLLVWRTRWRGLAIVVGALYVFTIGSSRLYLGVHYPTDVLGGWLLSLAWGTLVVGILYIYKLRARKAE